MVSGNKAFNNWLQSDSLLKPYKSILTRRFNNRADTVSSIIKEHCSVYDFSGAYKYFGLHSENKRWVFREWAPNASGIYLIGTFTDWQVRNDFKLARINPEGTWELHIPHERISHKDLYRLRVYWQGGQGDRIPAYARRVVQDPVTLIFNAQVWEPDSPYEWQFQNVRNSEPLLIYEAHVGMAQDAEKIGSFCEFKENVLPRIKDAGYNTIQLMAIQEHPYYGSFGYQVSSFFAVKSSFGTPDEFKELIDTAHGLGLRVIMDLIHSHAVSNEVEGLSRFDGSLTQYFHEGARGFHSAWNSRCFDYKKHEVLAFLLSNCRFWLEEYKLEGFRFDGITSMIYLHHGMGKAFTDYSQYFDDSVDEDALNYLSLANTLIHEIKPDAITIAEDVSGMPGLASPVESGGIGFDYRFAMGVPDFWIKLTKDCPDESWPMGKLWFELTNRRSDEKTISYAESHDQALVGDQTLIFRLMGSDMYHGMSKLHQANHRVERGMALHRLIRLITLATAGNGYLNFMGNEFGHPEWIDFPREGNGWSFKFAKRQWHLVDNSDLRYRLLAFFDKEMIEMAKKFQILQSPLIKLWYEHDQDKILVFERAGLFFIFNFHPFLSFTDYQIPFAPGKYKMIFTSDLPEYGGHDRLEEGQIHFTKLYKDKENSSNRISLYLPSRTAMLLQLVD